VDNRPVEGGRPDTFHGLLMPVRGYRRHLMVDLAILTVKVPPEALGRQVCVRARLTMPAEGDPLVLLGYPGGSAAAGVEVDGPTNVTLEYPLTLTLGAATECRETWGEIPRLPRSWPGVDTDAPMPSAMSGGAVMDRHNRLIGFASSSHKPLPPEHPDWSGYVNLAGFLLDIEVDVPDPVGNTSPVPFRELVKAGQVPFEIDTSTFFFNDAGNADYRRPTVRPLRSPRNTEPGSVLRSSSQPRVRLGRRIAE
jgi:hypothetical protein